MRQLYLDLINHPKKYAMSSYSITGKIVRVLDPQAVGQSGKLKREFWLEFMDGQYMQTVKFETMKPDLVSGLSNAHVWQERTVHFNLRGRRWDGPKGETVFNTLDAWKVECAGNAQPAPPPPPPVQEPESELDDLPF